jgi:mxaJ protein
MSSRCPRVGPESNVSGKISQSNGLVLLSMLLLLTVISCRSPEQAKQPAVRPQPVVQTSNPGGDRPLRVCADPNNLPFSNQQLQGFENKIAALLARDMNTSVEYTWWAQRRGFIRNTLKEGVCDVVIGVPSSYELALTTAPYYRSTYAFVYRKNGKFSVHSFDDPILRTVKVGVQMIGDDFANTPPAHALSNRHIIENVRGYSIYGDYSKPNPPARIIDAVANGDIDVAVVWGPLAGYFAKKSRVPLEVIPVSPQIELPHLPFVFDISIGVRHGDNAFKDRLDDILNRRKSEINSILDEYGVPRVDEGENSAVT